MESDETKLRDIVERFVAERTTAKVLPEAAWLEPVVVLVASLRLEIARLAHAAAAPQGAGPEDRSEPPPGYEVKRKCMAGERPLHWARADMPTPSRERADAVAACWYHYDQVIASARLSAPSAPQGGPAPVLEEARGAGYESALGEVAREMEAAFDLDLTIETPCDVVEAIRDLLGAASPPHRERPPCRTPNAVEAGLMRAVAQDTAKLETLGQAIGDWLRALGDDRMYPGSEVRACVKNLRRILAAAPHREPAGPPAGFYLHPPTGPTKDDGFGEIPPAPAYVPKVGDWVEVTMRAIVRGTPTKDGALLVAILDPTYHLEPSKVHVRLSEVRPTSDEPGEVKP